MNDCCKIELIQEYILDMLTELERTEFEDHVFNCDHCLAKYMNCVESQGHHLPIISNEEQFTELIMTKIPKRDTTSIRAGVKRRWHLQPLVHYGIAASITLLLITSGVFQGIIGWASSIEEMPKQEKQSISQNVMKRALQWINFNEINQEEGKQ